MKTWTIVDYPQIKTSEYLDEMRKLLGEDMVYCYLSNEELDKLCPPPKEVEYTKFEASIEPDKQHLNKSYDDFSKENKKFMTLRQGILLNLSVYKITGERFDVKGITRASTLDSDGFAMCMCRDDVGRFRIGRYYRDGRNAGDGPREINSLFTKLTEKLTLEERLEKLEKTLKDIKPLTGKE